MRTRLISFIVGGFLIGALAGAAILLFTAPHGGQAVQSSGTALVGGPFSLVGTDGKTVTDADFRGRYMLIFFGFTHCPDICPAELQVIAQALDKLGDKGKKVVPVFVTLDPERDTPQVMGEYVKSFGPNFVGLTGSPEAPITNVRIVVKNVSAIPYAFVSGLITFYDAAGVRCGEGVFKADALATNESFETDAPGLRIRCEPASWRLVAINLLPRIAPNQLVAPLSRATSNLEIVIDGESHPIQLDKPLVLTLGERRRIVVVRAAQ